MKCGNCGSDLPEDSIYCPVCGGKTGDEQSNVVNYSSLPFGTVVVCPRCGAKNSRTDRWCGSCDADLDAVKKLSAPSAQGGPDCPECGARGVPGSNYCRICGNPFVPIPEDNSMGVNGFPIPMTWGLAHTHSHEVIRERQVIMVRCKYCGTLNGPSAQKCNSCGATL